MSAFLSAERRSEPSTMHKPTARTPADPALAALQAKADASATVAQLAALQRVDDDEDLDVGQPMSKDRAAPVQRQGAPAGNGGLPTGLRSGIESMSGQNLGDVRVHRNSSAPANVGAHAFAQGRDIHLAPGQDRHLPHEAWHVVQQAQGRVKPTMDAAGVPINDDPGLEAEADRMGAQAMQRAERDGQGG